MIVLITNEEKNPRTGEEILLTSHGYDSKTLETIILPHEPPWTLGAEYDDNLTHWVINDKKKEPL